MGVVSRFLARPAALAGPGKIYRFTELLSTPETVPVRPVEPVCLSDVQRFLASP
jgi:hypothetical protein